MHEDLSQYTDEELFAPVSHSDAESEKIAAPRYSYWKSVFRVFFRKKVNIIALCLLLFVILFAYIYPAVTSSDAFAFICSTKASSLPAMYSATATLASLPEATAIHLIRVSKVCTSFSARNT